MLTNLRKKAKRRIREHGHRETHSRETEPRWYASKEGSRADSEMETRSWSLQGSPSLQELLEVQRHFNLLSPVLVEKDWYVVRALAAINATDAKPFRLVFSGGTAVMALAREIIQGDVQAYGHQFPAYRENPIREILSAVRRLPKDDYFAESYATFVRDMVYGETPDFKTALATGSCGGVSLKDT